MNIEFLYFVFPIIKKKKCFRYVKLTLVHVKIREANDSYFYHLQLGNWIVYITLLVLISQNGA